MTENAALFRLERMDTSHEIDLLSENHLVKTGIVHKGKELPRQRGATFQRTEVSIAGVRKSAIDAHPPWQGISGDTFGEWALSLPDSPHIRLEFNIGLAEGSENSDGVTFIVSVQGDEIFRQHYTEQKWEQIHLDLTTYRGADVKLRFSTNPGPKENTGWDWARWGEPKITSEPSDTLTEVGFYLPNEPIKNFPDTVRRIGQGRYVLNTKLPAQVLFLFESGTEVATPLNLRDTDFVTGLQFDGIFRRGSVRNSGQRMELTLDGVNKETIFAHPPHGGQTVLQFLLSLPKARELMFSFSMGLQDGCSDGVFFRVLVNGETQFEHFADTFRWKDINISLSRYAGEHVLLELVTDPGESNRCDWAHWADLFITAKGAGLEAPNQIAAANQRVRETKLLSNYPNPFNPETWIPYQLAEASDVSMKIYEVSGHLVRTISVGFKPVGYYLTRERAAYWDGRNETGEPVSSGVYFLQFVAGDFVATQRVVIVK
ncbi:MAG: T9SS type A sorting domain-containing protein [Candidatus Poribacteria bacterium]|nr:T9SS type A sorting domain-containing protein [Candidatus Poribacteria bacterium]